MTVAIRLDGEACEPGSFAVESLSNPPYKWVVLWQTEDLSWCACPWFTRTGGCRHSLATAETVGEERRARYRAAPPEVRAAQVARLKELEEIFRR